MQASLKGTCYLLSEFLIRSLQRLPQPLWEPGTVQHHTCHVHLTAARETGSFASIRCLRRPLSKKKDTEAPWRYRKGQDRNHTVQGRP